MSEKWIKYPSRKDFSTFFYSTCDSHVDESPQHMEILSQAIMFFRYVNRINLALLASLIIPSHNTTLPSLTSVHTALCDFSAFVGLCLMLLNQLFEMLLPSLHLQRDDMDGSCSTNRMEASSTCLSASKVIKYTLTLPKHSWCNRCGLFSKAVQQSPGKVGNVRAGNREWSEVGCSGGMPSHSHWGSGVEDGWGQIQTNSNLSVLLIFFLLLKSGQD